MVLGTAYVFRNCLKISHEITKISVLAGNSYGIVPLYMFMRLSSQKKVFKYVIPARTELGYSIVSCSCLFPCLVIMLPKNTIRKENWSKTVPVLRCFYGYLLTAGWIFGIPKKGCSTITLYLSLAITINT